MWQAFRYQLRMATEGVRRKPGLSVTILVVLSLAGGMWTFGVCRYLRHHGPYPDLSPDLHQIEFAHGETPTIVHGQGTTQVSTLDGRPEVAERHAGRPAPGAPGRPHPALVRHPQRLKGAGGR